MNNHGPDWWIDSFAQELKQAPFYNKPFLTAIDSSLPGNTVDIGSEWDYPLIEDIEGLLIGYWMEQDINAHVFWYPFICYRLLVEAKEKLEDVPTSFGHYFIREIPQLHDLTYEVFGRSYFDVVHRASHVVAEKYWHAPKAKPLVVAVSAFAVYADH